MADILIIFHSQTGNTEKMAKAVAHGVDDVANAKAVLKRAGNDGSFALSHIERICRGYRFKMVQKPILCKGRTTEAVPAECFELGSTIAEGVNPVRSPS
jgi:flavorubredoxin